MNQTPTPRERIMMIQIRSSDPIQGCRLSNERLSRKVGMGERQIRACLASLRAKKLVTVQIVSGNQRIIRLTAKGVRVFRRK